jgi:hypothetical protein
VRAWIVQSVELWDTGWTARVRSPTVQYFSLLRIIQTQPPIQCVPEAPFPGLKRQGREADHSPLTIAEVKNGGATPPLSHTFSRHSA